MVRQAAAELVKGLWVANISEGTFSNFLDCKEEGKGDVLRTCKILLTYSYNKARISTFGCVFLDYLRLPQKADINRPDIYQ